MALAAFLFTDIVGSTCLWADHPNTMRAALEHHDRLIAEAVGDAGGSTFKHTGDGSCSVFGSTTGAVLAAAGAQRALAEATSFEVGPLRVRMGVHAGDAIERDGDWFGPALNRCARLMDIAHGGQILLSGAAHALLERLPDGLMARDFGIHRLRDLAEPEHVWQLGGPDLAEEFPPLRSLDRFRGRLPSRLTPFIGRERELQELSAELAATRLVTLVGAGGMGKTRLALQVAAGALDRFADGVWFVELAPLAAGSTIDHAVATTLGFESQGGLTSRELLRQGLASWRSLLVLDNCEHLVDATRDLAGDLLGHCDQLSILATSRAPLRIPGERVRSIYPLDAGTDAAALLADRARATRPGFSLGPDNAEVVTSICEQLDGMPLAIELAAARFRSMTPTELLERLGQRFRLLRADRAGIPSTDRHATLSAVVDWSYDLLGGEEQRLLGDLGTFAGGFDLAAAHAVRSGAVEADELDTLDRIDALVDQSLVQATEVGGRTRYSLLETLRQYLDARQATDVRRDRRARHAAYFLDVAREANEGLRSPDQAVWLQRLEQEHDNFRTALAWALSSDGDPVTALGLGAALGWFWRYRSHLDEGQQWLMRILAGSESACDSDDSESVPSTTRDHTRALIGLGLLDYTAGMPERAQQHLDRARREAQRTGDRAALGWALHGLGRVALDRRDGTTALELLRRSIEQFEAHRDTQGLAYSMFFSAASLMSTDGDVDAARQLFDDAVDRLSVAGDTWGLVSALAWRATLRETARPSAHRRP